MSVAHACSAIRKTPEADVVTRRVDWVVARYAGEDALCGTHDEIREVHAAGGRPDRREPVLVDGEQVALSERERGRRLHLRLRELGARALCNRHLLEEPAK